MHTPGPWRRCKGSHKTACICGMIWAPDGKTVVATAHIDRCDFEDHGDGAPPEGTSIANARLIAAAPELLAACEKAVRSLQSQQKYLDDNSMSIGHNEDALDVLRAAIVKATREGAK